MVTVMAGSSWGTFSVPPKAIEARRVSTRVEMRDVFFMNVGASKRVPYDDVAVRTFKRLFLRLIFSFMASD
jgi:hypothetical protein